MKSMFLRLGAVLCIAGSTLIGPALTRNLSALAIPEDQVVQKLRAVPVFAIGSAEGGLLTASLPEGNNSGKKISVSRVFINQQDAQSFLQEVKSKNPTLGNTMQVLPLPLSEVYQMFKEHKDKPERLVFEFVPRRQQVDSAMTLLRQQGREVNQFTGVPLFIARGGPQNGYLTLQQGQKEVVLFFFNKEDLQGMIEKFKQQEPSSATSIKIEVASLEKVIEAMLSENEPFLGKIEFVPPPESRELIKQAIERSGQNKPK